MKRYLVIALITLVGFTGTCFADGYDLSNMTTQQLYQLQSNIIEQLNADHEVTSSEESQIKSAVKSYVENYYGSSNVSWAWINYSYTKEWDYFTMSTHADVKKGNESTRCDIFADLVRLNDQYQIVYLTVGNDKLIDVRNEKITDQRVRNMLGLSNTPNEGSTTGTYTDTEITLEEQEDSNAQSSVGNEVDDDKKTKPETTDVVAKLGDKNDIVKEIQEILIRLNYLSGNADGSFGKRTKAAVISFQRDCGLEETGYVTQEVYYALKYTINSIPESVTYARYTAKEVYSKYESNEIAGDSEFKGKIIEVTGNVDDIGTMFGTPYVTLKADSYGFELLHFDFSKNDLDQLATLREDQTITIRAKCTGWSLISVYFNGSEIVK